MRARQRSRTIGRTAARLAALGAAMGLGVPASLAQAPPPPAWTPPPETAAPPAWTPPPTTAAPPAWTAPPTTTVAPPPRPVLPGAAELHLELPLLDAPFNLASGGAWPSMSQSLWVTTDLYQLMHFGLGRAFGVEDGSHPV